MCLQAKLFSTHKFHLEALTAASGKYVMGSGVLMVVLDSSILCGKKKQIVFYYVEGLSFLTLESVSTWIIFFECSFLHCQAEGQELQKSSVFSVASGNSHLPGSGPDNPVQQPKPISRV